MVVHEHKIRVCYGDTDKMGVVYYGTYPRYYEIARTEFLRSAGITYREIEEMGFILPVRTLEATYLKPAYYDDLLTLRTIIDEIPTVKLTIKTEIYNEKEELINKGIVVLVFTNAESGRPVKPPKEFINAIENFQHSSN